jgi:hypothetical protein
MTKLPFLKLDRQLPLFADEEDPVIVFLGVDRPIPQTAPADQLEGFSLDKLEFLLWAFPQIQLVLASSWSLDQQFELQTFPQEIRSRIVGVTPCWPRNEASPGYLRRACEAWLRIHRPEARWLAIGLGKLEIGSITTQG